MLWTVEHGLKAHRLPQLWLGLSSPTACGILVPRPGIEPVPLSIGRQICNHWTTRKFLVLAFMSKSPDLGEGNALEQKFTPKRAEKEYYFLIPRIINRKRFKKQSGSAGLLVHAKK